MTRSATAEVRDDVEFPATPSVSMFALGSGILGVHTGLRSRRRGGGAWLQKTEAHVPAGPAAVFTLAGMLGALGQVLAGSTIWVGLTCGLIGAAIGLLAWRRARRCQAPALAGQRLR